MLLLLIFLSLHYFNDKKQAEYSREERELLSESLLIKTDKRQVDIEEQ